jgi:penicillin-binding protein 2
MEATSPRLRLSIIAVVVISLFGALFARMWYLQVMVATRYQVQATADRVRTVQIEAPRGLIYDDRHRLLVGNRTSLVVTMDPVALDKLTKKETDDLELRVATELTGSGVPTKVSQIKQDLVDKNVNHLQPIPIAIDVPDDVELYFAERASEYPGVAVQRESVRRYPYGSLAANVLGYVSRISDVELKEKQGGAIPTRRVPKPYQADSEIGKTGIEAAYEDFLRGTPGIERIEVDAQNNPVRVLSETPPIPGDDIQLTIDIDAQRSAETALAQELAIRRGKTEGGNHLAAPAGSVVALNPNGGGVIAMATYPTYNPADFVNGISSAEYAALTQNGDANNPLINRATQGQYAPGSTFKLITATAALEHGLISAGTYYDDTGGFTTPNCTGAFCFKRNSGGEVLGEVNLPMALTKSSDAYFYRLGYEFYAGSSTYGPTALHDMAVTYGLAKPTGIPIGNESVGFMPDAATIAELHRESPKGYPDPVFHPGQAEDAAIGQGVLVTPLQLANAYNTFANHGTVYEPQVVAKILKPGGNPNRPADVVRVVRPVVKGRVPLPPEVYAPILQGLQGVVSQPGGTATAAFSGFDLTHFPLAGKTGTAQVTGKGDTSLFASFGPVGAPRYTIVAVLEESGFGADAAAPVVRHVWETVTGQQLTHVTDQQTGVFG